MELLIERLARDTPYTNEPGCRMLTTC